MERPHYLRLARRCVDELSLYQAVWDPPFLTAPAHGGFGVMNGDCEWNDARQSLFVPLYLELHRQTSDAELLERAVSALRASFSMMYCPENEALARAYERRVPFFGPESYGFMMENQGHDPSGAQTEVHIPIVDRAAPERSTISSSLGAQRFSRRRLAHRIRAPDRGSFLGGIEREDIPGLGAEDHQRAAIRERRQHR